MQKKYAWLAPALVLSICLGCGSKAIDKDLLQKQQSKFDQAVVLFESNKLTECLPIVCDLDVGGGLSPDQAEQTLGMLIECSIHSGDTKTAEEKLTTLESVATDSARVLVLKGLLARKKGSTSEADEFFSQAQQIDPDIRIPQ